MTFTKMAFKQHEVEVAESWEELEETDVRASIFLYRYTIYPQKRLFFCYYF